MMGVGDTNFTVMKISAVIVVGLCTLFQCRSSFAVNEEFVNSVNARCACLGEVLAFSCTVVDGGSGATVWGGSAFDCGGNKITLIHRNFNHGTSAECNDRAIIGESISVSDDETCFTSRLNVTISIGLRNKTINCSDSGTQIIGSSTIGVADACSEVKPVVYLTKVSQGQLTLNWSRLNSECSTVQYLITSDCGNCPRSINDETSATCSNLQLLETERNCTFSIMSMTRGFNGTPSNPLTATLKVPEVPQVIDLVPVYSSDTEALVKLIARISRMDSFFIYGSISGSVVNYTISYSSGDNSTLSANCTDNVCEYMDEVPSSVCPPSSDISMVSVSAANRLGSGRPSEPISLACVNTFVTVDFNSAASTVTCQFHNQSSVERTCSVEYSRCDQEEVFNKGGNNTLESPGVITLQLSLSNSPDCYTYRVVASDGTNIIVVEGKNDQQGKTSSSKIIIIAVPIIIVAIIIILVITSTIIIVITVCKRFRVSKDHGTEVENLNQVLQQYEESGNSVATAYESDVDNNRDTSETHKRFSD